MQSSLHRAAHGDPTPDLIVASRAMIEPSAAPRQLVTKPLFLVFLGFGVGGGDVDVPVNLLTSCMLRELRGCLGYIYIYIAHVYLYIIYIYIYTYTYILMFRQLKLTCRGMFHCTFSNNWTKLATLADNGARTKEHKAQRTKGAKKHQLPKGGAT